MGPPASSGRGLNGLGWDPFAPICGAVCGAAVIISESLCGAAPFGGRRTSPENTSDGMDSVEVKVKQN